MAAIDVVVQCRSRISVAVGVGIGVCEVAGGFVSSWSLDPNRPRSCRGRLFARRRPHFVVGASLGQFFAIGINKRLRYTVPDDNFDCVFEDGDTIKLQGVTLLFFKIGRIVYDLKYLKTSKLLLELNFGAEISNITLRVENTRAS